MRHPFLRPFDTDSRGGPQGPVLRLSNWNVWESEPVGENVGGLTINGTEDYASQGYSGFTIVADPDGKFELNGTNLDLAAPLDYETKAQHFVTIEATHATDPTLTVQRTFTIRVINAAEGEFAPLELEIPRDTPVGTVIAYIDGLDATVFESFSRSSEPQFAISGNQLIVAQPIPSNLGGANYLFWTNYGREYEVFVRFVAAEPSVYRLATRQYGAGYNAENVALVGDGTVKTYSATFVNESGRQMDAIAIALQAWGLTTTGTQALGNDSTVSASITYNGITQTFPDVIVGDGDDTQTDDLELAEPIPPGASFIVTLDSLVPSGQKYLPRLGFAGVLNKAAPSEMRPAYYGIGDSIATNNAAALMNASVGKAPVYQASIVGTTALTYATGFNFARQANLAARLGVTAFVSNFGTNDLIAGRTAAQVLNDLQVLCNQAKNRSVNFVQATMLPRVTKKAAVAVTSLTCSGTLLVLKTADVTIFEPGQAYSIAGATPSGYNGTVICTQVYPESGEANFQSPVPNLASPATGTITITARNPTNTKYWQQPANNSYAAGNASERALFNQAIRNARFDGFIEWADAIEPFRDAGRFAVAGEKPELPEAAMCNVINGGTRTTTRFMSNYEMGSSTLPNGLVQFASGANAGLVRGASNNTNGDITLLTALTAAPAVGDAFWAWPGVSYISDDGIHPRISTGGKGGQVLLDKATADWLDEQLAAA